MNTDNDSFWMVWSPEGGAPTFRHPSKEKATKEAERLASFRPGQQFFVVQAIARVCAINVVVTELVEDSPF